jgi:hypothetical protein
MSKKKELYVEFGKQSSLQDDYRRDCAKLTASERLACVQQLRETFWGDEAATGRLQRLPEYIKCKAG